MYKNLLNLLVLAVLLPSCNGTAPHISVVCEENNVGNCIVKWEMAPLIKGNVKVYASTNPDHIPEDRSRCRRQHLRPEDDCHHYRPYTTILLHTCIRRQIPGKDCHPQHQHPRHTELPGPGRLFLLSHPKESALGHVISLCRNRQAETVFAQRAQEHRHKDHHRPAFICRSEQTKPFATGIQSDPYPHSYRRHGVYPERCAGTENQERHCLPNRGADEPRTHQQLHQRIPPDFDILLDKNNYPVVIHCSSGKGRTGIVSALVLASLGVDEDIIMEDYRLSNDYFNIPAASRYAYQLPARSQEAITTLFSAREDFLNAAIEEMERRYGDTDTYLQRGIGLTKEERKRLQDILLVDN